MKKILFKIKNNTLIIKEKQKLSSNNKNLLNTNIISKDELLFSLEYLNTNVKIVSSFIKEITNTYEIDTVSIEKLELCLPIINILKNNTNVINLIIKEDIPLTFKVCEVIAKSNIKNISCYSIQPFMIEYLDKKNILVESRNEILYISNFMLENNLTIFSSLFYKMSLEMDLPLKKDDEEDFEAFAKINKYLKTIHVNYVNKSDLEYIISILRKNNKKNIKIVIHDNISDEDVINYLKEYNKKKSKKYKIYFKLEYSNEYIQDNLLKQTNYSILKVCGYIILFIIALTFSYIFYDNYKSMKNNELINTEIKNIILDNKDVVIPKEEYVNEDVYSTYKLINPDTVGWLTVNNTNINYPVVQASDNSYYLNHNIFSENDKNGWVFMDYRSDIVNTSDNVIIYAHNRYYNGIMFGHIQTMMRYNYYTNPDNQIITLKGMNKTLKYQIFSMYKIETTLDYLRVIFESNEEKLKMFDLIKNRSIYNFNVELLENDKILTLSTCADEHSKYVVHAKLINEET